MPSPSINAAASDHDAQAMTPVRVLRVGGLRRGVVDLRRAIDFYCGALGFAVVAERAGPARTSPRARLALGHEHIDLVQIAAARMPAIAVAPDPHFQHAAIVAGDMNAAWQRLRAFAPAAISEGGVRQLPANTGGVTAFKFRDPDGHPLELIHFPAGVGDPRWHSEPIAAPTLGIDHFALVVADVERSVAFYTAHGFRVASRQVNRGPEQGRLDGLPAPVVEVVALQAARPTPHIELLGYRHPAALAATSLDGRCDPGRDAIFLIGENADVEPIDLRDPDGHCLVVERR